MPPAQPPQSLRITTAFNGSFTFQLGVDEAGLALLRLRIDDARRHLQGLPLAQLGDELERTVLAGGVFASARIEGGTLNEEAVREVMELTPGDLQGSEPRRVYNLIEAGRLCREVAADPDWQLDMGFIQRLHSVVTDQLPHEYNRPGELRSNPRGMASPVGKVERGGQYQPPQYGGDVSMLLEHLLKWHQQRVEEQVPAMIRAPLLHFYFEVIHPFWLGNGRVGRLLEATLLMQDGLPHAPLLQSRYYLENIDRYFSLFNQGRRQAELRESHPNTDFVEFFLEGLLSSINHLHQRASRLIGNRLFRNELQRRYTEKQINPRQYAIATQVLEAGAPIPLAGLRKAPWYQALYSKLTDKTRQRDLSGLKGQGLIIQDSHNRLVPGSANPR